MIRAPRNMRVKRLPQPKLLTHEDYVRLTPPDSGNYELHNGKIIFMASPLAPHQIASMNLSIHLGLFIKQKNLGRVLAAPMDVKLTPNDTVQPDLLVVTNERLGIIKTIVEGAPDLTVEIKSLSNSAKELAYKKYLYESHEVREYWLVNPDLKTVRQYVLEEGELNFKTRFARW
ncbi:MAG: Uma2 family endonuclease [Saprospiraceae bacterium]|nr:Uma2 family endonuclease [Saprospiraceae bacterium]